MKAAHVITGLDTGGAETMLLRLLERTNREEFETQVFSMTGSGPVGEKISALGVPVHDLKMQRGVPNPVGVSRLVRRLRADRPDVVQTWMYQADLVGGLAARLAGGIPTAWGIHSTELDPGSVTRLKKLTVRACALSSRFLPAKIVCCSEASRRSHADLGYPKSKMVVIPNGCDPSAFVPDPDARPSVRRELGIPEDAPLVGFVARFDAPKDHEGFVKAAAMLRARVPEVRFVLCGGEITRENRRLVAWIEAAGVSSCFHLLGRREDVPRLTAALDVASSSSFYGEAWPLVVGEAMAAGVPCAVTDVGDAALIVGDTGRVVPPKDPSALANAWHELLSMSREERVRLGEAARRRVEENFDLSDTVARYEELYRKLARTRRAG